MIKLMNGFLDTYVVGQGKEGSLRGIKGIFGNDGYVHYLDSGDDFIGVYICQNIKLYNLNMHS